MDVDILSNTSAAETENGPMVQSPRPMKLWIRVAAALLLATILIWSLLIDLVPRFHMGDSGVFILTRLSGYIPDNRSWTYGLSIGWLLRTTRSLLSVVLTQVVFSWTAFAIFAIAVYRSTRIRFPTALLLVLIGACEPLGYYWSRSIMADSPAQSVFVFVCAFLLLPLGNPLRVPLVFVSAFALISLRSVYFPALAAAILVTIAWLLVRVRSTIEMVAARTAALGWAAILGALLLADLGYAWSNTYMTHGRSLSTNIGDMEFLVGALSPLMGDELDKTPLTRVERRNLIPLTYENRVGNTFNPHGLVPLIRGHFSSTERARPSMQKLVLNAVMHHPIRFTGLALRQWLDYLNPVLVLHAQRAGMLTGAVPQFRGDTRVVLPTSVVTTLQSWKVRPHVTSDLPSRSSVALSYVEEFGGIWSLVLAYYGTFSLVGLLIMSRSRRSAFLIFVNSFAFLYMATIACGANQMVTRYLLPLDVPLMYCCLGCPLQNP